MPKISFLFPGQGAQYVGMGKEFYDTFPESKEVFEIANAHLDFDITALCFEENEKIHQTEYTQAAIFTVSEAIRVVLDKRGIHPELCAGLSLGEYNALVASGILPFEDAIEVVRKRGILMEQAVPKGKGAMAAIFYMDSTVIEEVCKEIDGVVQIANYNSPIQTVISGESHAVTHACERLKLIGAKKVVPLKVSGPFHSFMLSECGMKLSEVLQGKAFYESRIPYITNVTAECITIKEGEQKYVKDLLVKQVSSPVLWKQSIEVLIKDGTDIFVEVGPGKTLTGLLRQINKKVKVYNVEKVSDLEEFIKMMEVNEVK